MLWRAISPRNTSTGIGGLVQDTMRDIFLLKKICTSVVSWDKQEAVLFQLSFPSFLPSFFSPPNNESNLSTSRNYEEENFPFFFLSSFLSLEKDSRKEVRKGVLKGLINVVNVVNVGDGVARIVLLFDDCSNNSRIMMAAYISWIQGKSNIISNQLALLCKRVHHLNPLCFRSPI